MEAAHTRRGGGCSTDNTGNTHSAGSPSPSHCTVSCDPPVTIGIVTPKKEYTSELSSLCKEEFEWESEPNLEAERMLRTTLEQRYNTLQEEYRELEKKYHELQQEHSRCSRVTIPGKLAKEQVKTVYAHLDEEEKWRGFDLQNGISAASNKKAMQILIEKCCNDYKDKTAPLEELKGAARNMFRNKRDTIHKKSIGTYDAHKARSKRRMRLIRKLERRKAALDHVNWDHDKRETVDETMTPDYMSSETEDDDDVKVRRLEWESEELRLTKAELDTLFARKVATRRQRQMLRPKLTSTEVSTRRVPDDAPAWTQI